MLAVLLSQYQLVLSMFVYVSLSDVSWSSLSISVSVVRVSLCLGLSKDLLNSLSSPVSKALLYNSVSNSLLQVKTSNNFITLTCQRLLLLSHVNMRMCTSKCEHQRLIFWVFVASEFYRQRDNDNYI